MFKKFQLVIDHCWEVELENAATNCASREVIDSRLTSIFVD